MTQVQLSTPGVLPVICKHWYVTCEANAIHSYDRPVAELYRQFADMHFPCTQVGLDEFLLAGECTCMQTCSTTHNYHVVYTV